VLDLRSWHSLDGHLQSPFARWMMRPASVGGSPPGPSLFCNCHEPVDWLKTVVRGQLAVKGSGSRQLSRLAIVVNRDDDRHESQRLARYLRSEIETSGKYPPGAKLPSYRQLVAAHGVARNTVAAAIRLLEAEGIVDIRPASGVYVRDPAGSPQIRDLRTDLKQLRDQLQRTKHELVTAQRTVAELLEDLPAEGLGD
jgi:DNA-binding transcriptional regulator YhcF (GntR family)